MAKLVVKVITNSRSLAAASVVVGVGHGKVFGGKGSDFLNARLSIYMEYHIILTISFVPRVLAGGNESESDRTICWASMYM